MLMMFFEKKIKPAVKKSYDIFSRILCRYLFLPPRSSMHPRLNSNLIASKNSVLSVPFFTEDYFGLLSRSCFFITVHADCAVESFMRQSLNVIYLCFLSPCVAMGSAPPPPPTAAGFTNNVPFLRELHRCWSYYTAILYPRQSLETCPGSTLNRAQFSSLMFVNYSIFNLHRAGARSV